MRQDVSSNVEESPTPRSTGLPFADRVFPGWIVLAGSFLGYFAYSAHFNTTYGVFIYHLGNEMGWGRRALAGVTTVARISEMPLAPWVGANVEPRRGRQPMLVRAVIVLAMLALAPNVSLFVALLLLGISSAGFYLTVDVMWANYFGRLSLATVRGIAQPVVAIFAAIGPLLAGVLYDTSGSYASTWFVLMIAFAIAAGVVQLARRPTPPRPVPPGE